MREETTMTISMYQASAPAFLRTLGNLKEILAKASTHATARKIKDSVLLETRLYPDMFPLVRQVQIASDFARGTCARLAGVEPPPFADEEKTFAELADRLDRTIAYVRTFAPAAIDGSEGRKIERSVGGKPHTFTGQNYLLEFALPNFYFHSTTAYAILRHSGIEIGKSDFIGALG
jgi:hypothetical protein